MIKSSKKKIKGTVKLVEPTGSIVTDSDILNYYQWYHINIESPEKRIEFLTDYLKHTNQSNLIDTILSMPHWRVPNWTCWVARLLMRGFKLPDEKLNKLNLFLSTMQPEVKQKRAAPSVDFRARIENAFQQQENFFMEEIELELDACMTGIKRDVDIVNIINDNNINTKILKGTIELLNIKLQELYAAKRGEIFGFSNFTKKEFSDYIVNVENLIKTINDQINNKRAVKQLKKNKKAGKATVVNDIKYCKIFGNVVSENSSKLVGASMAVVYNIKYKYLGVIVGKDKNLQIRKTIITNINEPLCIRKKFSKDLLEIQKMSLKEFNAMFAGIKSTPQKQTNRLSEDYVIVKIYS
jgi:hypothetical protein